MGRREKIAEILAARSTCREGSLSFSCQKVEFSLKARAAAEGSFIVNGREDIPLSGMAVTGDIHMRCLTPEFAGSPAEIFYRFDSAGLDEGDTVRGTFRIISNQGEYTVPFAVTVMPDLFETSLGQMKNLFHFANLARTSWQEAVRVFYSRGFEKILTGNDRQYLNAYRGLSVPPHTEQKVEEFLVYIRKKQYAEFVPDRESIALTVSEDITRAVVALKRNGWGYTRIRVETEGGFLEAEKDILTEDDFIGNQCPCGFLIMRGALHAGCNYGKIRFSNEYLSLEIPVCAKDTDRLPGKRRRSRKQRVFDFYRYYLQYTMGKITRQEWLTAAENAVAGMEAPGRENPARELFQAHLMLTRERRSEARWLLDQAGGLIVPEETRPEILCYYLYLTTLVTKDEHSVRAATEEIRRLYREDQTNWEIAWLLLYLDEECARSLSRKWVFLEQQFEKGCRSPVWYMEAAMLVRKNPAFLMKLTPFVMQTLNFMAKYDYLNDDCIRQIHYLSDRLKEYSDRMYAILKVCYDKRKDGESLRAICGLLIKGNKIGPEYAGWYRRGIENELWLTRLYEYYILSVDLQGREKIPMAALRYFSYRSELPWERTAWLYAYVMRKRERYPELFQAYLPDMERFLEQQLEKGRMNADVAFLYREMIQEEIAGEDMLCRYGDRLFIHEIRADAPDVSRVIAVHGKLRDEAVWPVSGGRAYVPVYDSDFCLVFEKVSGGRFVCDVPYEDRILFYPQEMLMDILPESAGLFMDETGVVLYQCEHGKGYTVVDRDNVRYARLLWSRGEIRESYRSELTMRLLQYYSRQDISDELDEFLPRLQPQYMNGRERAEALQYMIMRGMYDTAYEWLGRYGAERMRPKPVARMCSRLLARGDLGESETMTALVYFAFCGGKYDDDTLRYLSGYFRGTIGEMQEIRRACNRFDAGSSEFCERLLLQMLFTGEHVEEEADIFRDYLEGSADEALTDSYLAHFAYEYFIRGQEPAPFVWKELKRKSRNGEPCDEICELALLRFYSGKELDQEETETVRKFMDDLVLKKGIVFEFFRNFTHIFPVIAGYTDKTFLEYRSESQNPLILHYMLKADGKAGEYRTDELKSCYAGIYVRSFQLFSGEILEYYITEKKGDKEKLIDSGALQGGDVKTAAGRFGMINRFIAAVSNDRIESGEKALEQYYQTEFSAEKLFALL